MIPSVLHVVSARNFFHAGSALVLSSVFLVSPASPIYDERAPARHTTSSFTPYHIEPNGKEGKNLVTLWPAPRHENDSALTPDLGVDKVPPAEHEIGASRMAPEESGFDEGKQYLWSVYQRSSTKFDSHGDFTWKDAAAAARLGLSIEEYVIGGMDPDFREQLFAMGHAMDAAGINWSILSAFRDDYRQSLAVGFKAQAGNSFHGGSAATGGYGHGCAVDLASTDPLSNYAVWNWLDQYGEQFGLYRPLRRIDPAHIQPSAGWHKMAATLRAQRMVGIGSEPAAPNIDSDPAGPASPSSQEASSAAGLTEEQFLCVRPRPAEEPSHVAAGILSHLKPLLTHLSLPSVENRSKAKLRTAGGSPLHRINTRHSDSFSHHAHLKEASHLMS
jgi:hypothetical protein